MTSEYRPLRLSGLEPFTIGADSLFVNVGSATDHCEQGKEMPPDSKATCPETMGASPRGVISR